MKSQILLGLHTTISWYKDRQNYQRNDMSLVVFFIHYPNRMASRWSPKYTTVPGCTTI